MIQIVNIGNKVNSLQETSTLEELDKIKYKIL